MAAEAVRDELASLDLSSKEDSTALLPQHQQQQQSTGSFELEQGASPRQRRATPPEHPSESSANDPAEEEEAVELQPSGEDGGADKAVKAQGQAILENPEVMVKRADDSHNKVYHHVCVCTEDELGNACDQLEHFQEFSLDCEGVSLSRIGELTVLMIKPLRYLNGEYLEPIQGTCYVIDVLALGGRSSFNTEHGKRLKAILESDSKLKVTFDCRTDSDALWHQCGVLLTNVLDCQVFDQGCRLARGDAPPRRVGNRAPFVTGMARVAPRYLSRPAVEALRVHHAAPHKDDPDVWRKRPLTDEAIAYAAGDCHVIAHMVATMKEKNISEDLMSRVLKRSEQYVNMFRGLTYVVTFETNRTLVMTEVSLLDV